MRLKSVRIRNFKCFKDTGWFDVAPARTVIVGENNSGKSTLLSALTEVFENQPFRSEDSIEGAELDGASLIDVRFTARGSELAKVILRSRSSVFLPVRSDRDGQEWWRRIQKLPDIEFEVQRRAAGGVEMTRRPSFSLFKVSSDQSMTGIQLDPDLIRQTVNPQSNNTVSSEKDLGITLGQTIARETYVFGAQRVASDECPVGVRDRLSPDGANLAEVLQNLQASSDVFAEYIALVKEVLPSISKIGARPAPNNRVQVWISMFSNPRPDLYQRLRECGTGVGQVLALLYVVARPGPGQVIVIDEPNSFLHPGAMRRLFGALKRYKKHQFIVSTHSPEVISACEPQRILMSRWKPGGSEIIEINPSQISEMRLILNEVGARLADVFGADRILWVEGPTEEQCFPLIMAHFGIATTGMLVLGLLSTGDVISARRKSMYQGIYRKLSSGQALIPPAVAIVLDREALSDAQLTDERKASGNLVEFHPRRTYENYLLSPQAIAQVLDGLDSSEPQVGPETVKAWLDEHGNEATYFGSVALAQRGTVEWDRDVDAAKILRDVFRLRKIEYQKVAYGLPLTEAVLAIDPERFAGLQTFLKTLVARNG